MFEQINMARDKLVSGNTMDEPEFIFFLVTCLSALNFPMSSHKKVVSIVPPINSNVVNQTNEVSNDFPTSSSGLFEIV